MLGPWVTCLLLPIAVPVSGGGQVTIAAVSGRAGAAIPTGAGRVGRSGCAWEKEGAEQSQAGLLQRSVLPAQSHTIGIQQGQCHCRHQGIEKKNLKKKKRGTITLNNFCYFYSLKAGFWGYEWNLCTQYFRLTGKKNYKCCIYLQVR